MPITSPDTPDQFFDPADSRSRKIYESNKMVYPTTADEKALELKMDKIRTIEGKYNFKRSVVRLCRYMDEDGHEFVDTEEMIDGKSSIGNPQQYWSRDKNYSHPEADVAKIATLQNGEQIIVTGDYIKHIKRVFDVTWEDFKADKNGIKTEIMSNVKDNNLNKLTLRVEGYGLGRSYSAPHKKWWDIWFNYDWEDLLLYCQTGRKKDDVESINKQIAKLSADQRAKIKVK